jgi:hypothetical protein
MALKEVREEGRGNAISKECERGVGHWEAGLSGSPEVVISG